MKMIILKGKKVVGGKVEGKAMVTRHMICFLSSINSDGLVIEQGHELYNKNVAGTILVFPSGRGSTSGSYRLYEMALNKTAPKAIINVITDPVIISGAVLGNIPTVHKFDRDPTAVIKTGDHVIVDADAGTITIKR